MPVRLSPSPVPARCRFGMVSHRVIASLVFGATTVGVVSGGSAQERPVELPPIRIEADEPAGTSDGKYNVERSASPKYTQPLREVPQTITIVPKEVIEERGATTLRDVLRNVPGISISAGEGGVPLGDNLTIRGFGARTDMFIDGVRDFGNYFRDPFNLQQVEVVKGPASAYSGRGSTGGSINQISKWPFLGSANEAALVFGSDETKRVTLDVNQPLTGVGLDNVAFRLNALAHDSEIAGRDHVERQRWGFAPSLAFGLGTPTQLTLGYYHLSQDNIPDYGHPFVNGSPLDVDRSNFYGLVNRDYEETSLDVMTAEFKHAFSNELNLRNLLRYGYATSDYIVSAPTFSGASFGAGTISRNSKSRDAEDTILINQTDLTSKFRTGPLGHTLVTGVELARETTANRNRQNNVNGPATSLFSPNPFDPGPPVPYTGAGTDGTADSVALYAFDTIALHPQWDLTGGLRWDRVDLETESTATNGTKTTFNRIDSEISWRVGLVYKPAANGSLYAVYGTSFNPSGERLTLNANNELLDPEETKTYEVGTKWDLMGGRLALTGAVFRVEKTNARTDDPLGIVDQVLQGEQRVDGFEIGITGSITERWKVFAGYTRLIGKVIESGNPAEVGTEPVNVAPHSATLWTTYDLPWRLRVGFGAQAADSRRAGNAESSFAGTSQNRVQGYVIFDAMLAYQLTEKIDLRFNVLNLTDKVYYDAIYSSMAHPGAARTFLVSTGLRF